MSSEMQAEDLPQIELADQVTTAAGVLVCAVGFEERALAFLGKCLEEGRRPQTVVVLEYEPTDPRNRLREFVSLLKRLGIEKDRQIWIKYQRYDPEMFEEWFKVARGVLRTAGRVTVDCSGMSRLLFLLVLEALTGIAVAAPICIVYAEATVYHPLQAAYRAGRRKVERETVGFLTSNVYSIVSPLVFSTVTMQGYPRILVAFPTFNPRELIALLNELSPQEMALINGEPHLEKDKWRQKAIGELNSGVTEGIHVEQYSAPTLDYRATLGVLNKIHSRHWKNHKLLLAPTGSKLQTLAVFLFVHIHPEVQIIYPITTGHLEEYTEGVTAVWQVTFDDPAQLLKRLNAVRRSKLADLRRKIEDLSAKTSS